MKLKDFIVRTLLGNTDKNQQTGDSAFNTRDYVFLEGKDEVESLSKNERIVYPSDYAVMNGAGQSINRNGPKNRNSTWYWLRSGECKLHVLQLDHVCSLDQYNVYFKSAGLCPALHLNLESVISVRSASRDFKINSVKDEDRKVIYHTIEFGSYPQDKADAEISDELKRLYNESKLEKTGKTYTGYMNKDGSFQQNIEFKYNGKKYVRVILNKSDASYYDHVDYRYKDGEKSQKKTELLCGQKFNQLNGK